MKRSLRTLYCLVLATLLALVVGTPTAAPDLGLQSVNLSCNDGTNLSLVLDAPSLTALTDAVSGIGLYPAGDPALACGLSKTDPPPPGSGNPKTDYAVGGGRATLFGCGDPNPLSVPLETNFALNARVDKASNGSAGSGTFNVTIPQSQVAACPQPDAREGHFNGKIDCVKVGGNGPGTAQATFHITQAAGSFSGSEGGAEQVVNVLDSGMPGGTGDFIRIRPSPNNQPCSFGPFTATRAVDNGNISVHEAS